jgi:hypothetical protein
VVVTRLLQQRLGTSKADKRKGHDVLTSCKWPEGRLPLPPLLSADVAFSEKNTLSVAQIPVLDPRAISSRNLVKLENEFKTESPGK